MNLNDLLEADLRTLANEGKKKFGDLKETAEKAINLLRQSETLPLEMIFSVLYLAKNTNNSKNNSLALSILQKLLTTQALNDLIPVLKFLKALLDESLDETISLKALQTLMLVMNPGTLKVFPELVDVVWGIFMSLQNNRSSLIKNTASATLRQLLSITYHKLTTERTEDLISSATILFKSSCELGKIRINDILKLKFEAFGLILEMLEISKNYIVSIPELQSLLENDLPKLILANLTEETDEAIGTKCIKCSLLICEIHNGHQEILQTIVKLAENRKIPEWLSIACLDFISQIMVHPKILKFIYDDKDLHSKLLDSLSKVSHEMFAQTEDLRHVGAKQKMRIVSEIISHWIDSIAIITEEHGIKLGEANQSTANTLPEFLVLSIWKPLLPILSIMVANSYNESILQTMLNSYQTLVNLAGTLNLSSAREALLASLCQFCIPVTTFVLTHKNMHICKTLFNITHCLGFVLDSKAWHKVLDTLYKLDFLLNSSKIDDPDLCSDISILTSAMESLFKNTHLWPDNTIVDLMSALGQLTLEFMETLATNDKKISNGKVFGIEKMIIVGQNNLERIDLYWDSLSAYLDCICNSKYLEIRSLGTNSLSRIILSAFKKFIENPPLKNIEKWQHWQRTLLLSLHDLLGSVYSDTQDSVFDVLYSILQSCGAQLDSGGWSMLLFILYKINMNSSFKEGFKCLQLIISDFLQSENLLPSLERLISCVSKYAHSEDSNQAIGAVGMYWNIADYLGKIEKDEIDLWWIILEELKTLGEDSRMEVRHSAIHSLHVALSTHGSLLSSSSWNRVIQDIILSLLERISTNYFSNFSVLKNSESLEGKNQKNSFYSESNEKQWEETYNIFTQNLGKIFRTFLNNLEKHDENILEQNSVKKSWDVLVFKLKEGVQFGTFNIITAVLKTIKELLSCSRVTALFYSKWTSSWDILVALDERLKNSTISVSFKLISIILEVFTSVYANSFDNPYDQNTLDCVYSILRSLLKSTAMETPLSNAKLLPEQREIWEFIEKLLPNLVANEKGIVGYVQFLLEYCVYNSDLPHSDCFCRKSLELIELCVEKCTLQISLKVEEILDHYQTLLMLRYCSSSISSTLHTAKGSNPIWYISGESFLKLLNHIGQEPYWEKIIKILETLLNPSEKTISKLPKTNLETILKPGEDLDIKMIEKLESLLLSDKILNKSTIQSIITIIDTGCESYYKAIHASELFLSKSFPNSCFNSLLTLCKENSKSSALAVPVFVARCKETITKFSKEEKLSGQMPLPKAKLLDMLDFLNEIKKLDIASGSFANSGKKAHLLEIFPQLCELITVKDADIKESLKQVFLEISRNM